MRLYTDLAWLWSEVTPVGTYREEASDLFEIVTEALGFPPKKILELGAGGGFLLHDLQMSNPDVEITLVDVSPEMLREAERRNPKAKLVCADMTDLDLDSKFDLVLLHDAVMYLPSREAASSVLDVMHRHVSEHGVAVVVPDVCRETFEERILTADTESTRAKIHFTEWHWDPSDSDDLVQVEFSVLVRKQGSAAIDSHHETHDMLVLALGDWMTLFMQQSWMQDFPSIPWMHGGEFFLLRPMPIA